jgi:hypothetical protein
MSLRSGLRFFLLVVAAAVGVLASSCECSSSCSSATCTGCCGSDGACHPVVGPAACGASGSICVACGNGQSCVQGRCSDGTGAGGGGGSSGLGGGSDMGGGANTGGGGDTGTGGGTSTICPAGDMCDVTCTNGGMTSISGRVFDPAGKNGLYNVAVYVPATDLVPLPKGVPTGAAACSCAALYQSGAVVSTATDEAGHFSLPNAPVGSDVHLVLQIGKWRKLVHVNVTACQDNPQSDGSLKLPSSIPAGNTDDNMPDIAVSTGSADTLECLMHRIGLPTSEYVAGNGTGGHVHVFSGGKSGGGQTMGVGKAENPAMSGAPVSSTDLWSTVDQMMPYDIVLLSCEGGETYNANPAVLESYLNAGGRAFGSHYHYAWFSGPLSSSSTQSYTAPADWGSHLASWSAGFGQDNGPVGGIIDTSLNGATGMFSKGVSLQKWLANTSALGTDGVPSAELAIYQPRYNATVTSAAPASQPWITSDSSGMSGATLYFSFDTPVNAPANPDGGAPLYCGRAVFSDLHVSGNPSINDTLPPPGGCDSTDLSPQEKALEFMLFDLSSCVVADTMPPPVEIQ